MLNSYLEKIQEDKKYIQEEPVLVAAGIMTLILTTLSFVINYVAIHFNNNMMKRKSKRVREYEDILNNIVEDKGWKIYSFKMNYGKNKPIANAMVFGTSKDIYVTEELLRILNKREVTAVLIHEVEHVLKKDVLVRGFLISLRYGMAVSSNFIMPFILPLIIYILLSVGMIGVGRYQETRSDKATVKYGYGEDLISALKKLEKSYENLVKNRPTVVKKISQWLDEHPTVKTRVEDLTQDIEAMKDLVASKSPAIMKQYLAKYLNLKENSTD